MPADAAAKALKRKRSAKSSSSSAWKKVEVADDFLLGLSEPGFQELEELQDVTLLGEDFQALLQQADSVAVPKPAKKAKRPKAKKGKASDADGDLRKRIAELEAENARLRAAAPERNDAPAATKKPAHKKRKVQPTADAAKADVPLANVVGSAVDDGPGDKGARAGDDGDADTAALVLAPDMSAWDDYGLDEGVVAALAQLGFTAPTAIQHECMPAAIQGNADIIGAAQTGSGKTLAFGLPILNLLVKEAKLVEELAADEADAADEGGSRDSDEAAEADGRQGVDAKQRPISRNDRLLSGRKKLRALVLCPTRELAMQVCTHLQAVAKAVGLRVVPIVGGISPQKQERLLSYKPPVVVATPGRLWDLMSNGHTFLSDLTHLSFLVLDEADRMVKQGHYAELTNILDQIPRPVAADDDSCEPQSDVLTVKRPALVTKLRTYVFSATLTLPDSYKAKLQRGNAGSKGSSGGASFESLMNRIQFRGRPKIADLTGERKLADRVAEAYVSCGEDERDELLYYLLALHPGRTIVFANAISGVRRTSALLKLLGLPVQALHAQQQQRQRLKALDRFRADEQGVLVATDVAARGLDIPHVRCVVQYQLPPTADTYIHRAGRTARAGEDGLCVAFVSPDEAGRFAALHRALDRPPPPPFPVDRRLLKEAHARVRLAQRIDVVERARRKGKADRDWMLRHSRDVGVDVEDDHESGDEQSGAATAEGTAQLRVQLAELLSRPLSVPMSEKFFAGGSTHVGASHAVQDEPRAGSSALPEAALASALAQANQIAQARRGLNKPTTSSQGRGAGTDSRSGAGSPLDETHGGRSPLLAALGLQGKPIGKKAAKKVKAMSLADYKEIALQKALAARQAKKGKLKTPAVPRVVYGRQTQAADALTVLRTRESGSK